MLAETGPPPEEAGLSGGGAGGGASSEGDSAGTSWGCAGLTRQDGTATGGATGHPRQQPT